MKWSIEFAVGTVLLLHTFTVVHCNVDKTAYDIVSQNLCICPCGNPKGGKLYLIPSVQNQNWFDAVAYCNAIGMSIAVIPDDAHRDELYRFLIGQRYNRGIQYWIGANNLVSGRRLLWGLNEREVHNPVWSNGREPGFGPSQPFCVSIYGDDMTWVGSDCEKAKKKFICEL